MKTIATGKVIPLPRNKALVFGFVSDVVMFGPSLTIGSFMIHIGPIHMGVTW